MAPGPSTTERIPRDVWVLVAAAFVIAIGFGLIAPVLPQFAKSYGVGATASAFVVSVFSIVRLAFAPTGGRLVTRLGERKVYVSGLLIVAASSIATAFAHSYWQLIVFRGIGGVGSVMFTVSSMALVVRLAPPTLRARTSSAYASAFLIGGVLGPLIGGLLGGLGLQVPFLVYGVALMLAAAVVWALIRPESLRPTPGSEPLPALSFRQAWSDGRFRAAVTSNFSNGWSNFGFRMAILPLFVTAVISPKPWVVGAALAVFAAGNAVGLNVTGRWADRRGRRPFALAGLLIGGVATVVTGIAGSTVPLFVLSLVAGAGAGLLNPAQQATVADVVGQKRSGGPALAGYQMLSDAGAIIGPLAAGLLIDQAGYAWAFALSGLVLLASALPWLRVEDRSERPAGQTT